MSSPGRPLSMSTLASGHVFGKSQPKMPVALVAKVLESDLSRRALVFFFTLTQRRFFEAWLEVPPHPARLSEFAGSVPCRLSSGASNCNPM